MSKSDEIVAAYRSALRLIYGDEIADKSYVYTSRGWYYVNLAQRFPDGSVGTIGQAYGKRANQIQEMTEILLQRARGRDEQTG